jgi:hypothetical protein
MGIQCIHWPPFERGVRISLENFGRYGDIDVYPLCAVGNVGAGRIYG